MEKLFNYRSYILIIAVVLLLGSVFFVRSCMYNKQINASVSPLEVALGYPVAFIDSTKGANYWFWEFGNGDTSLDPSGQYIYPQKGKYQIRLTVDGKLEKRFIVNVGDLQNEDDFELIKIVAPKTALQGEYITFRGEGSSKDWRWEFGESGKIDANEKTAIYQYREAGRYQVELRTEETKYPVLHSIEIIPQYFETDSTDVAAIIGEDIKEKLQAIIDQEPFNRNYNYVLNNYLCNNPNTPVIINNKKKNDFYSYCQGLRIIGRKKTRIEKVLIDLDDSDSCIKKLIVIQVDIN